MSIYLGVVNSTVQSSSAELGAGSARFTVERTELQVSTLSWSFSLL